MTQTLCLSSSSGCCWWDVATTWSGFRQLLEEFAVQQSRTGECNLLLKPAQSSPLKKSQINNKKLRGVSTNSASAFSPYRMKGKQQEARGNRDSALSSPDLKTFVQPSPTVPFMAVLLHLNKILAVTAEIIIIWGIDR